MRILSNSHQESTLFRAPICKAKNDLGCHQKCLMVMTRWRRPFGLKGRLKMIDGSVASLDSSFL
jgi:hypothetical protein